MDLKQIIFKRKIKAVAIVTFAIASFFVLFFINPEKNFYIQLCLFNKLTGWYCPGCGGIRGTHYLLNGEILKSIKYNLFLIPVLLIYGYYVLSELVFLISGKELPKPKFSLWLIIFLFVITISYTILRNLPSASFEFLRP